MIVKTLVRQVRLIVEQNFNLHCPRSETRNDFLCFLIENFEKFFDELLVSKTDGLGKDYLLSTNYYFINADDAFFKPISMRYRPEFESPLKLLIKLVTLKNVFEAAAEYNYPEVKQQALKQAHVSFEEFKQHQEQVTNSELLISIYSKEVRHMRSLSKYVNLYTNIAYLNLFISLGIFALGQNQMLFVMLVTVALVMIVTADYFFTFRANDIINKVNTHSFPDSMIPNISISHNALTIKHYLDISLKLMEEKYNVLVQRRSEVSESPISSLLEEPAFKWLSDTDNEARDLSPNAS